MEFPFNINLDFPTDVIILSTPKSYLHLKRIDERVEDTDRINYICSDIRSTDAQTWKSMQERLSIYVNVMGQKSAQAQGLKEPITSAEKLIRSNHRLYIIKDASANNGKGALVGILKVGVKKLFLSDGSGDQAEANPVCLLDFFVVDSRQRQGYGLRLFKVMLELEGITPVQLAIDKPSKYLLCFLKKYYKLDQPQFHPNKYVVFPGFFKSVREDSNDPVPEEKVKNYDQEKNHQVEVLNTNDVLKDMTPPSVVYCDTPFAPPFSPATVKSTHGISAPTRFNSERRWQQMYDTWNVLGVPPRDYSYIKNATRNPPSQSEIGKTIVPQPVKSKYNLL